MTYTQSGQNNLPIDLFFTLFCYFFDYRIDKCECIVPFVQNLFIPKSKVKTIPHKQQNSFCPLCVYYLCVYDTSVLNSYTRFRFKCQHRLNHEHQHTSIDLCVNSERHEPATWK